MPKSADPKKSQPSLIADNTQVTVTIPWTDLQVEYQKHLRQVAKTAKSDGFRVGKVPLHLVEQMVDTSKLYEAALNPIFPKFYTQALTAGKHSPISQPELEPVSMEPGKDWVFTAHFASRPTFTLGNYQDVVKKALKAADEEMAKEEAEHAKADQKPHEHKPLTPEQKDDHRITHAFQALLETVKVPVPEILVRQEANRQLEQLASQLNQFGLSAEKYLESRQMKMEDLRNEYTAHALGVLQTELIMAEIAKDQKITVSDKDVEEALDKVADGKLSAEQRQNPDYRSYLFSSLLKQKVVKFLLSLV
jgi:FKBP-type peptidyl-prolyl cis-trans isomerase (trigger factor)